MNKLFVFGIGGTGARVIKSLLMLFGAGIECDHTIIPIIIDRDIGNGDLTLTMSILDNYLKLHNALNNDRKSKFFKANVKLLNNNLFLPLKERTTLFKDFINLSNMDDTNKSFVNILYTKEMLDLNVDAGFQGNPNIGTVVLNQFDDSEIFRSFANEFNDGDKIMIINSIFGGTGASGFPLLRRIFQTTNFSDNIQNWGLINKAPIGVITVLPYFIINRKEDSEKSLINSDTFIDKSKAALDYYKGEDKKIDVLYYIGDKYMSVYEHHIGGTAQRNPAHFIELASALAILDFVNPENKSKYFPKHSESDIKNTTYKEFGILNDTNEIIFDDLPDVMRKIIINPLTRFLFFCKCFGCFINETGEVKKEENLNMISKDLVNQPFTQSKITKEFINSDFISKTLAEFQKNYVEWLAEMEFQTHKFSPFDLKSTNPLGFVKGSINIFNNKKKLTFNEWDMVYHELNNNVNKIKRDFDGLNYLFELFQITTENLINYKG